MSFLNNFIPNTPKRNQPQLPQNFEYNPQFLSEEVTNDLYNELTKELDWEEREITMFGKVYMQPRLIKWFGDKAYSYSKQEFKVQKMPPSVEKLKKKIEHKTTQTFNYFYNLL